MTEVCRTAEEHVARAQELLARAEAECDLDLTLLAESHLRAARTITAMEEAKSSRQARLDAKGMSAGMVDMLSRALPQGEDLS